MFQNTDGLFNTAIGVSALSGNTTGDYNTGIGYSTLQTNKTGSQNTAIGCYAGPNSFDLISNSTSIGYPARATVSNQVRLGNADVTSIAGQYKRDVKENVHGLEFINSLRPVTYQVDTKNLGAYLNKSIKSLNEEKGNNANIVSDDAADESGRIIYDGFVAQEVEEAAKRLGFVFSGVDKPKTKDGLYGLRYDNFVAPLVKAVQELSRKNDSLNLKIREFENLKMENEELKSRLDLIGQKLGIISKSSQSEVSTAVILSNANLEQNTPNPFNHTTTIHCTLPQKFITAQINISDQAGKTLKRLNVLGTGKRQVNIDASALAAGTYNY